MIAPSVLRSRARATRWWLFGALAPIFVAPGAEAQPAPQEPIRVQDRSPSRCTDAKRFYARMAARTARTRWAQTDEPSRLFIIHIAKRGDAVAGRLTIRNPDGSETHRDLRGRDCAEVANGLALVAALAVDPAANVEAAPRGEALSQEDAASAAPTAAPRDTSSPSSGRQNKAQPTSAPPPGAAAAPPSAATPRARGVGAGGADPVDVHAPAARWSMGAVVQGLTVLSVAPEPLLGGGLAIDLMQASGAAAIAPRFALAVHHAEQPAFAVASSSARFAYSGGQLDACPLRLQPSGALTLHACARANVGWLSVSGTPGESASARTVRRGWAALGLGARLGWALSERWSVELQGGCMFPLRRDTYGFGPDAFHGVPWIAGVAVAGIHLRLL